jgi:hypothetical protein
MAKVVSGILVLREKRSSLWTNELDTKMNNWVTSYLRWLATAKNSLLEEKTAK